MKVKHWAINLTTGEVLSTTRGNWLKHFVKSRNEGGEWRFFHRITQEQLCISEINRRKH